MRKLHTHYRLGLIGAALVAGSTSASADNDTLFADNDTLLGASGLLGGFTEGFSGEISAGYDSEYFFRGLWFGADNAWTGVDFSKELCNGVTANIGAYYLDTLNSGPYSESGISATLSWDTGAGTVDVGFTHYQFYDGFDGGGIGQQDATEVSLTYSTGDFYGFSGYLQGVWDLRIDAGYVEAGIAQSVDFGFASLDLSAAVGYSISGYYTLDSVAATATTAAVAGDNENGLTHVLVSAALPIQLTDSLTFTPHASVNIALAAREEANENLGQNQSQFFGGASFSVAF